MYIALFLAGIIIILLLCMLKSASDSDDMAEKILEEENTYEN